MIEQIIANIYRVEIPIPGNPLGTSNSYLVKGHNRNLIIDTGLGEPESMEAMAAALRQLGIDLAATDFFITHLHPDHFGLVSALVGDTARVYLNQREMGWLDVADRPDDFVCFARSHGFSDKELTMASHTFSVLATSPRSDLGFRMLKENDAIDMGDMHFLCVETPGHTRGHLCLFEPTMKIFLAGDHVLPATSPVLEFMEVEGWEPLRDYMASLDKVSGLDVERVLPGHGSPFRGHRDRVDELKTHHERKLNEILSLMKDGRKTALQLASLMNGTVRNDSWDTVPLLGKIIMVGDTVAHLSYLETNGDVRSQVAGDRVIYYSLVESNHGNRRA